MWKQRLWLCLSVFLWMGILSNLCMAQTPAFPGAEGGGKYVTGGRAGNVLYVNTLEDSPTGDLAKKEGSLRWCLNQDGARTILFKVSGIIELKSPLIINKGNVTIAGQSAPGDGICLKNYTTQVDANNVIIRYIRFRLGDEAKQVGDAIWGRDHVGIILDHCSMSWGTDECSSFYSNKDFTLQWCMLTESLRNSPIGNGFHGYGGIWGGENASFHHNLLAHHDSRNPRFNGWKRSGMKYASTIAEERVDFRNNVLYNWGSNTIYGGEAAGTYNLVNNIFKAGPASRIKYRIVQCYSDGSPQYGIPHGRFFLSGNYVNGNEKIVEDNSKGVDNMTSKPITDVVMTVPFKFSAVTTHPVIKAYNLVLMYSGCSLKRDTVDLRIVQETKSGKFSFNGSNGSMNGMIDSQKDVGGWPVYASAPAPADSDLDGIPDEWETAQKLNPNLATDGSAISLSSEGYTNLEVYLNSLVENITKSQNMDGTVMSN